MDRIPILNDKGRYLVLRAETTVAVFLIVQTTSAFAGILTKASLTVINVGASVPMTDPVVKVPCSKF